MIVSEKEHKVLWCPETRAFITANLQENQPGGQHPIIGQAVATAQIASGAANRGVDGMSNACLGRLCAMFRWAEDVQTFEERTGLNFDPEFLAKPSERFGYCGKAGKPEWHHELQIVAEPKPKQ